MNIQGYEPAMPQAVYANENGIFDVYQAPNHFELLSGLTILQQFAKDADVSEFVELSTGKLCELTGYPHPEGNSFSVMQRYRMKCLAKLKVMKAYELINALNELS